MDSINVGYVFVDVSHMKTYKVVAKIGDVYQVECRFPRMCGCLPVMVTRYLSEAYILSCQKLPLAALAFVKD